MPIQKLSPLIANQIAAGEVVERPASVVKELLENSIDAGSTRIQIDLERGGIRLIRITDNGVGIPKKELSLALARHATSKILEAKDLAAIDTLGFRGEALASISSVAKLTLSSKPEAQDIGWSAYAEGQQMDVKMQPHPLPFGSIVEVKDLFFNTPARQKFLKAERTEFIHIEEMVKKIALANPQLALTLKHNGKVVKRIPAANSDEQVKQRIGTIVGRNFIQKAIPLNSQLDDLQLSGWLGPVDYHQSSSLDQYFFVNGRPVRDRTISHAVRQAYHELLPPGRSPAFVLFLQLPADKLDVNVHPTKHEVRFIEGRRVHDYIIKAIETSLDAQAQELDLSIETAAIGEHNRAYNYQQSAIASNAQLGFNNSVAESGAGYQVEQSNLTHLRSIADSNKSAFQKNYSPRPTKNNASQLWFERFLVTANNAQVTLLDLKTYMLELTAETLQQEWQHYQEEQEPIKQKPILIPIRLELASENAVEQLVKLLPELGIELAQLGPTSIVIRKLPSCIEQFNLQTWLQAAFANLQAAIKLDELKTTLIAALESAWQPDHKTNWQEFLQQRYSSLPWQKSEHYHQLSPETLLQWIAKQKA
ncbi:MAG: DNA mismatch repair endonuclease MutL [Gammaproteobacteria bacterium]|nr:DNA mismatch repair endonuclease MutL [Gammaproteobacteria bacterium]